MNSNERKLFNKLTEHNISITILWGLGGEIKDIEINTAEHDAKVRADAEKELQEKIPKWHIVADGDLPRCEEKVVIVAERKYRDGTTCTVYTTAMYEDGTIRENDSCWYWEDIEGEYDEEEDCLIVPRGWYECKNYTPDGELNYEIADKVIAWIELPTFKEEE